MTRGQGAQMSLGDGVARAHAPVWSVLAAFCVVWIALAQPAAAQHAATSDEHQITALLRATFDNPQAPLSVAPVVVAGDHAIAGWVQDSRGGRALMRKVRGTWTIHLCSGDPLKHADMLASTGIPADVAKSLAERLAAAERALPAATVALFSTFEGVVHMGADGQHPPAHHGHAKH